MLREVDPVLTGRLTPNVIQSIVDLIPDLWLDDPAFSGPAAQREAYLAYFHERLRTPHAFVEEAINARSQLV
jgi:hypothetical protein